LRFQDEEVLVLVLVLVLVMIGATTEDTDVGGGIPDIVCDAGIVGTDE